MLYSIHSTSSIKRRFRGFFFRFMTLCVNKDLFREFQQVGKDSRELVNFLRYITHCPTQIYLQVDSASFDDPTVEEPTVTLNRFQMLGSRLDLQLYIGTNFNIINTENYGYRIEEFDISVLSDPIHEEFEESLLS